MRANSAFYQSLLEFEICFLCKFKAIIIQNETLFLFVFDKFLLIIDLSQTYFEQWADVLGTNIRDRFDLIVDSNKKKFFSF